MIDLQIHCRQIKGNSSQFNICSCSLPLLLIIIVSPKRILSTNLSFLFLKFRFLLHAHRIVHADRHQGAGGHLLVVRHDLDLHVKPQLPIVVVPSFPLMLLGCCHCISGSRCVLEAGWKTTQIVDCSKFSMYSVDISPDYFIFLRSKISKKRKNLFSVVICNLCCIVFSTLTSITTFVFLSLMFFVAYKWVKKNYFLVRI